jgi:hypothetical protein
MKELNQLIIKFSNPRYISKKRRHHVFSTKETKRNKDEYCGDAVQIPNDVFVLYLRILVYIHTVLSTINSYYTTWPLTVMTVSYNIPIFKDIFKNMSRFTNFLVNNLILGSGSSETPA